jgi:hypothetical protein
MNANSQCRPLVVPSIGSRLELMIDDYLIEQMDDTSLQLQTPQKMPQARSPLIGGYTTVIKDGDLYRAIYRANDPNYTGKHFDGDRGVMTCYAESRDGHEWTFPELGLFDLGGSRTNNIILHETPACHTFAPFLDTRPGVPPSERFKALAGLHDEAIRVTRSLDPEALAPDTKGGLYAFASPDCIHWRKISPEPVIPSAAAGDFGFDSQNVSFWSETEGCYVCYFRSWQMQNGQSFTWTADLLRTIRRVTSQDYRTWSDPQELFPNEPNEHLYTSQTHPYFRAPHIYIATPTRFMASRGESTDILFMTARGNAPYTRTFKEAFIRPGPDSSRWGNRANYVALNVVPTGPAEMSIYHDHSGHRFVLRTDGFASVHAGYTRGEMLTRPFTFTGAELILNLSTSAAGSMRVEIQDAEGRSLPGFGLDDCTEMIGDDIARTVLWKQGSDVSALAGQSVRLRFAMKEADLFSLQFRTGPAL